ncbi:hypothetical protein Cgig2_027128 [Carnegiea gigantea]|uniref:Uncharacterized protein n=1 Tax=Carnegiea gigantea TaxID=171969 RepID=A0A9Q1QDN4_9CARY|nr:hypothetical protein Cgig2_027128 [Carnegiea gigantea]
MTTEWSNPVTMVFDGYEGHPFTSPHNDLMVVELKVTNALVHRILIDTKSSTDIITRDCLKKLKHARWDIASLVHPILGFESGLDDFGDTKISSGLLDLLSNKVWAEVLVLLGKWIRWQKSSPLLAVKGFPYVVSHLYSVQMKKGNRKVGNGVNHFMTPGNSFVMEEKAFWALRCGLRNSTHVPREPVVA